MVHGRINAPARFQIVVAMSVRSSLRVAMTTVIPGNLTESLLNHLCTTIEHALSLTCQHFLNNLGLWWIFAVKVRKSFLVPIAQTGWAPALLSEAALPSDRLCGPLERTLGRGLG